MYVIEGGDGSARKEEVAEVDEEIDRQHYRGEEALLLVNGRDDTRQGVMAHKSIDTHAEGFRKVREIGNWWMGPIRRTEKAHVGWHLMSPQSRHLGKFYYASDSY